MGPKRCKTATGRCFCFVQVSLCVEWKAAREAQRGVATGQGSNSHYETASITLIPNSCGCAPCVPNPWPASHLFPDDVVSYDGSATFQLLVTEPASIHGDGVPLQNERPDHSARKSENKRAWTDDA